MVVEAAFGVELCRRRHIDEVGGDQATDPIGGDADDLRPDLLVIADDDGPARQAQHGQGEDVGLGCLVNDHDVEDRVAAVELLQGTINRHDPHRYGRDGLTHRPLGNGLPMAGALARALADLP